MNVINKRMKTLIKVRKNEWREKKQKIKKRNE